MFTNLICPSPQSYISLFFFPQFHFNPSIPSSLLYPCNFLQPFGMVSCFVSAVEAIANTAASVVMLTICNHGLAGLFRVVTSIGRSNHQQNQRTEFLINLILSPQPILTYGMDLKTDGVGIDPSEKLCD